MDELTFNLPYRKVTKVGNTNNEPSMTRPNQSLSLIELFQLYRQGRIVEPIMPTIDDPDFINYLAEMEDHDLTQLDKIREKANELHTKKSNLEKELLKTTKKEEL